MITKPSIFTKSNGEVIRRANTLVHIYLSPTSRQLILKVLGYGIALMSNNSTENVPSNPYLAIHLSWQDKRVYFTFFKLINFHKEWN